MTTLSSMLRSVALSMTLLLAACSQTPTENTTNNASAPANSQLSTLQHKAVGQAQAHARKGEYHAARNTLERLLEQQPNHPELWANLATLYYQMDEPEACIQALERARQLAPENAQAMNLEGTLALQQGELDAAKHLFKRALESEPEHPEAHYNLALIYDTYYQDLERAVHHYQAYLQFNTEPDNTTADWLKQLQSALKRQQAQEQDG